MGSTREIPTGEPFELSRETVGLERTTGRARFMDWGSDGPPRIDGYTVGAPMLITEPPHVGEMHPDADELLYMVSGRVRVRLELDEGDRETQLGPGQAVVVPRGVWHRIFIEEPGQLIHITPGPGGQHRPLPGA
jgi:mannose-6-phosphate isomerase-like protein (cupin superfamily)